MRRDDGIEGGKVDGGGEKCLDRRHTGGKVLVRQLYTSPLARRCLEERHGVWTTRL